MRIAFSLIGDGQWTGGLHYLLNLLTSLSEVCPDDFHPILFIGHDAPADQVDTLRPYLSEVIQDKSFTQWTPSWIARQTIRRTFDRDIIVEKLFKRKNIDVVFHAGLFGTHFAFPCVNWIPDFQHLHIPEMFSAKERKFRNNWYRALANMSKRLLLSSECAKKDFGAFWPDYPRAVDVLNFVARLPEAVYEDNPLSKIAAYPIPDKFFHLPNQFWKHKNHLLVINALKKLKNKNPDLFVVCTGDPQDHRHPEYFNFLKSEVQNNGIEKQIALMGLVPRDYLFAIMRQSIAILNPSFFEGWSTTVEEAKSLGKKVLLSDIPVHREQEPPGGTYFNPTDPGDLAAKMLDTWEHTVPGPDFEMEKKARSEIQTRVDLFANQFADILRKAGA